MSPSPTASAIARWRRLSLRFGRATATAEATSRRAVVRKISDAHQKSTLPAACIHGK